MKKVGIRNFVFIAIIVLGFFLLINWATHQPLPYLSQLEKEWKKSPKTGNTRKDFIQFLHKTLDGFHSLETDQVHLTEKTVFIGVLTLPEKYAKRSLLRSVYRVISSPKAELNFVFCEPKSNEMKTLALIEQHIYHDILILNCKENMDDGKTYTYFSSLPSLFPEKSFKFAMKVDDDTFLHIPNLVKKLDALPSTGTFYGRQHSGFMAGMGYVLSWDLIQWISQDSFPKEHQIGQEDAMLSWWLSHSGLDHHRVSDDEGFYDEPLSQQGWAHNYTKDTVLIHRLKNDTWFLKAARHFMNELNLIDAI